jgi:ferrous iron transport protein A
MTADDRSFSPVVDQGPGTVLLSDLAPGTSARIVKVSGRGAVPRRIVDMGVTRGSLVYVERVAPLGDPMQVKIRGYHLSLRRSEARMITVAPV